MVFTVNEMVPHVLTTPTCLNALSVPMLRQVSKNERFVKDIPQKSSPGSSSKSELKTFRSSLAKVVPRGSSKSVGPEGFELATSLKNRA